MPAIYDQQLHRFSYPFGSHLRHFWLGIEPAMGLHWPGKFWSRSIYDRGSVYHCSAEFAGSATVDRSANRRLISSFLRSIDWPYYLAAARRLSGHCDIGVSELVRITIQSDKFTPITGGVGGIQRYELPLNFAPAVPNYLTKLGFIGLFAAVMGLASWQLWVWGRKNTNKMWQAILGIISFFIIYICGAIGLYNYDDRAGLMLLTVTTLAIIYFGLERLINSPWGRVLKAIREDEEVPKALGKNVFWYKLQALMLGGGIAGIAGAFYAWQITSLYPSNFEPLLTFNAWTIVSLGGAGNNVGVILGAVVFWAYDTVTRLDWIKSLPFSSDQVGAFRIMIIGLILMIIMLWRPQGLLGNKDELTLGK